MPNQHTNTNKSIGTTEYPLVSCLLPTENRARFIKYAIHFFMMQDYPNKELIILYSKDADIPANIECPSNITFVCTGNIKLGAKRNYPINFAKGELIAQWDDDDIYHPCRLSAQIAPLLSGEAEITGLQNILFYEVEKEKCWHCSPSFFKSMFDGNVACGTIVFKKNIWGRLTEYPDVASAEDGFFLVQALKNGARLKEIDGRDMYIYTRHRSNTWRFRPNFFGNKRDMEKVMMPEWARAYENFYKNKSLFIA